MRYATDETLPGAARREFQPDNRFETAEPLMKYRPDYYRVHARENCSIGDHQ